MKKGKSNGHPAPVIGRPRTPPIDLATTTRRYITLGQLAEYMSVSRRTLYYHIDKGALLVVKRGGVIRIKLPVACAYAEVERAF